MFKKIIRIILISLIIFLIFLGLILFFLTISPGESLVKKITEKQLTKILNQQVQIGDLETNLFSRFQMNKVQISKDQIDLVKLGFARIEYNLFDLLKKKISIKSFLVDSLQVYILKDSLGQFNLPVSDTTQTKETGSDTSKSNFSFQIGKAVLQNSVLFYLDEQIPVDLRIDNLNLNAESEQENTLQYQATIETIKLKYLENEIKGDLSASGSYNSEQFELSSIKMNLPGLKLSGNTKIFFLDSSQVMGKFELTGTIDSLANEFSNFLPEPIKPLQGEMNFSAAIDGVLENPTITANLLIPELQLAELSIKNILFNSSFVSNSSTVENFQFNLLDGKIKGNGSGGLDSSSFNRFDLQISNLDLAQLLSFVYQDSSLYKGKINGKFLVEGIGLEIVKNWKTDADLIVTNLTYNSKSIPDVQNKFEYKNGKGIFYLKQDISEATIDVLVDEDKYQGEFSVALFNISTLAGLANIHDVSGQIELDGNFEISTDSPVLNTNFAGRNLRYSNFPVDSISGAIQYENQNLYISNTRFIGALNQIDSTKSPFYLTDLHGGFYYEGFVDGTLQELTGSLKINLMQPGFEKFHFDQGQVIGSLQDNKITVDSFLGKDSLLVAINSNFDIKALFGDFDLNIYSFSNNKNEISNLEKIENLDKQSRGNLFAMFDLSDSLNWKIDSKGEEIDIFSLKNILPDTIDLGGFLQYHLNFKGTPSDPNFQFNAKVKKPRFELVELDSSKLNIIFENGNVSIDKLELFYKNQSSWVDASLKLNKNKDGIFQFDNSTEFRGTATGNQFDLQIINPFLQGESQLSGLGTYRFDLSGTPSSPKILGNLEIEEGGFQQKDHAPILSQVNLQVFLEDSLITFRNTNGIFWETPWNIDGKIEVKKWQDFFVDFNLIVNDKANVTSRGWIYKDSLNVSNRIQNFNLAVLQSSLQGVSNLNGSLNASVDVSGKFENPQINGILDVHNLEMIIPDYNTKLSNGLIKINFDQQRVIFDSVFSRINDGSFLLQGNLKQEKFELTDVNLKTNINNIQITRLKKAIVHISSAKINYSKQNDNFLLGGDIILGETKMIYNLRAKDFVSFSQSVERPPQELPPLLQKTRLDLRLRESDKIWIDNNLARIRMHSELALIGSPANPNVAGRLTLEEGYVLYLDRKFKINKGVIDFIDPNKLNPIIDLETQAILNNYQTLQETAYKITLTIKGPLDQVVVDLTSEPPLEKSDIVSLLTIGATREQLTSNNAGGKESSVSTVLLERAKALSSARITGYAERRLGDLFGLDQMTIEGNLFKFDKSWGPQLLASKKISERVTLIYSTVVGHMNEQSVRLDYRLTKKFSVEGQTDQRGNSGIDLKYRIKFK